MLKEDKFKMRNGALFLKGALCWDPRKNPAHTDKITDTIKTNLGKSRNTRKSRSDYCNLKK